MSLASSKRLCADPEVDNGSIEDWLTIMEGRRREEQSSSYEDGFYKEFILAHANVPIVGIMEIAESELIDFLEEYPQTGYSVHDNFISRETMCWYAKGVPKIEGSEL